MTVFSSLQAARESGFHWFDFGPVEGLHLVVRDLRRLDGRLVRVLAFARSDPEGGPAPPGCSPSP